MNLDHPTRFKAKTHLDHCQAETALFACLSRSEGEEQQQSAQQQRAGRRCAEHRTTCLL